MQSFMKEGTEDAQVCTFKRIIEICSISNDFVNKGYVQCIEINDYCMSCQASLG